MLLATFLPIGTVLAIGALLLACDRWGATDRLGAAQDLRRGTSPLHRKRKLSDALDEQERWALRRFEARNGRAA
jgi:hypothetical protein